MIKDFLKGYIYNLARVLTLYLAALYFSLDPLQEADK